MEKIRQYMIKAMSQESVDIPPIMTPRGLEVDYYHSVEFLQAPKFNLYHGGPIRPFNPQGVHWTPMKEVASFFSYGGGNENKMYKIEIPKSAKFLYIKDQNTGNHVVRYAELLRNQALYREVMMMFFEWAKEKVRDRFRYTDEEENDKWKGREGHLVHKALTNAAELGAPSPQLLEISKKALAMVNNELNNKGYSGFIYDNNYEGGGHSFITLDPNIKAKVDKPIPEEKANKFYNDFRTYKEKEEEAETYRDKDYEDDDFDDED